ncbi:hypothetical protein EV196_101735 [Mariniflexile fucanivorans]|uniref:Uncharacterized protein n=1 Tax=Mariniflexile fucanivorans TaxID=264023 RepID=A0A4V2QET5_9FLAO|nr:hypothetical protein [Mariniflexile fucanivorans]TCL69297.1 hypothetical protein EV196_101735 [Mariniflexile fucanivorans]
MGAHKLFCSEESLEEIFMFKEDHLALHNIVEQFCDVVLNIDENEISEKINDNPFFKSLFKREHSSLSGNKDKYKELANKKYANFLNDILLLDLKQNETEKIRDQFGVLAISLIDSFIENQNYHFGYTIDNKLGSLKCWSELFKEKPVNPINSAIIIDNFLWNDLSKYRDENDDNIYPILENLIPKSLEVPFHLLIVLQNKGGNINKEKVKEIIKKMNKKIVRNNGIDISVVTQTDTRTFHERVIITNYHYIYSHKGFVSFAKGKIKNETNGDRNWVFKDINNYVGQIRKHQHLNNALNVFNLINNNNKNETSLIFNIGNVNSPILSNFN